MSMFMFQHSRRRLLARLIILYDERTSHEKEQGKDHDVSGQEENNDLEQRRTQYLKNILGIADQELKKMEYWSDLVDIAKEGKGLGTAEAIVEPPPPPRNEGHETHD